MLKFLEKIFKREKPPPPPPNPYAVVRDYYRGLPAVQAEVYGNIEPVSVYYPRIDLYIAALRVLKKSLMDPKSVEQIHHPMLTTVKVCEFYLDKDNYLIDLEIEPDEFFSLAEDVIRLYDQERQNRHKDAKLDYVLRRTAPIVRNLIEMAERRIHEP